MPFVSFTKGPRSFPYVFIITGKVPTLIPIDGITLGDHGVFVLGGDQEVFDGAATFEESLDAIPTTDLFDTFTKTLCVGNDYVSLTLNFLMAAELLLVPWLLTPPMASLEDLLSLFSTFLKAHLGYLHWLRAFLRCSFSCLSNSGLLHTVWTLWERVLITLNLAERLWWLSHCRYWSLWVGFLYTVMDRPPSSSGFTMVSKKGMELSSILSSTVNFMAGSTLLMC